MKKKSSQKSNGNPLSNLFRNDETHQVTENHPNSRKYSETFGNAEMNNFQGEIPEVNPPMEL